MILQLAIPVNIKIAAPIRIAKADVSPIHPGIRPRKQFLSEYNPSGPNFAMVSVTAAEALSAPTVVAKSPRAVAPVYPSAIANFSALC